MAMPLLLSRLEIYVRFSGSHPEGICVPTCPGVLPCTQPFCSVRTGQIEEHIGQKEKAEN
jgi:hypothetical protein